MSEVAMDTDWFQNRLRDREISQRRLAEMLGLGPSAVSLMLRGKRKMTMTEAADMSRLLGIPVNDVMAHAGIRPGQPKQSVPLFGIMDKEGEIHTIKGGKRIACALEMPDTALAVQVQDSEFIADGMTFFYEPRAGIDAESVGRFCVIELATGQRHIRFLKPGRERGLYNLVGWFSVSIENVKVKTASPILWIKV
jgi:transcriptional regulator with XRE-family HTH domain